MTEHIMLLDLGNSYAKLALLPVTEDTDELVKGTTSLKGSPQLNDLSKSVINNISKKVECFENVKLIKAKPFANNTFNVEALSLWLKQKDIDATTVARVFISSVRSKETNSKIDADLHQTLDRVKITFVQSEKQSGNLFNKYGKVDSLGVDRWVAAVAANAIFQAKSDGQALVAGKSKNQGRAACLVADAGSALTIELIEFDYHKGENYYHGGMILPGLRKMLRSLSKTDNLPLIEKLSLSSQPTLQEIFANNTEQAMISGVQNAMIGSLNRAVDVLKSQGFGNITVFVTGGDKSVFQYQNMKHPDDVVIMMKQDLIFFGMLLVGFDK